MPKDPQPVPPAAAVAPDPSLRPRLEEYLGTQAADGFSGSVLVARGGEVVGKVLSSQSLDLLWAPPVLVRSEPDAEVYYTGTAGPRKGPVAGPRVRVARVVLFASWIYSPYETWLTVGNSGVTIWIWFAWEWGDGMCW